MTLVQDNFGISEKQYNNIEADEQDEPYNSKTFNPPVFFGKKNRTPNEEYPIIMIPKSRISLKAHLHRKIMKKS